MVAISAQLDPSVANNIDVQTAFRDVLTAIGVPSKWVRDEEQVAALHEEQQAAAQAQQAMMAAAQGAQAIEMMGKAGQAVNNAQAANQTA